MNLFHLDSQSYQPSQGTRWGGKGRLLRQKVGSVGFPFPPRQAGVGGGWRGPWQGYTAGATLPPDIHCPSTDSIKE